MTYNEWRDELKSNLLSFSESERKRVLDYYAEQYADRREAGYSEREIIDDFGAPYDAAQIILSESSESYGDYREEHTQRDNFKDDRELRREEKRRERAERRKTYEDRNFGGGYMRDESNGAHTHYAPPPPPAPAPVKRTDQTWIFVILCIVFAAPLFGIIMAMAGITIGLITAPFALLVSGVAAIGAGIGAMFADVINGAITVGAGLIVFGLSLILLPLCVKLVKLMWSLFGKLFSWLKSLFSGKEKTI